MFYSITAFERSIGYWIGLSISILFPEKTVPPKSKGMDLFAVNDKLFTENEETLY